MKFKNQIFLGQFTNPLQHYRHVKYARRIFLDEIFVYTIEGKNYSLLLNQPIILAMKNIKAKNNEPNEQLNEFLIF